MADSSSPLGAIIRRQRELSKLSMRSFARLAGISNPYLSQVERGLREPSERVVEAIAGALQTSADTLYEQAGIARGREADSPDVLAAIRADRRLSARQRQALAEVYAAFVAGAPPRRSRRGRGAPSGRDASRPTADEAPTTAPDPS